MNYLSREGQTIDEIVWQALGTADNRVVEITYELNQNLAKRGETLPAGVLVRLPDNTQVTPQTRVTLWS